MIQQRLPSLAIGHYLVRWHSSRYSQRHQEKQVGTDNESTIVTVTLLWKVIGLFFFFFFLDNYESYFGLHSGEICIKIVK